MATEAPVLRNQPCPCGSGRKYRDCHGRLDSAAPAAVAAPPSPQALVDRAQQAHQQGRLDVAETLYRQALAAQPRHGVATHYLGLIAWQRGRALDAEPLVRASVEIEPGIPQFWNNLGLVLRDAGRPGAVAAFERARALDPGYPDATANLADTWLRQGEARRAIEVLGNAPATFEGLYTLGLALERVGRYAEARDALTRCREALPPPLRAMEQELANEVDARQRLDARLVAEPGAPEVRSRRIEAGSRIMALRARLSAAEPFLKPVWRLQRVAFLAGDVALGWQVHPWRAGRREFDALPGHVPGTHESFARLARLDGLRFEVWCEQGLGDTLFFLRYAPRLRERGALPTYLGDARLFGMLSRTGTFDALRDETLPPVRDADIVVPAGDLLSLLGDPDPADFPPPLALGPLAECIDKARAALGAPGPSLAVTWRAGTQGQGADVLSKEVDPFELGQAVRGYPGTVVSVQRLPTAAENRRFREGLGRDFVDLSGWNPDLEGMLALMAIVDDYAGVSNTNMHLRAGVGRRAHVLVSLPADWRWPLSAERSPWFPAFHVLHQHADEGWGPALARLALAWP